MHRRTRRPLPLRRRPRHVQRRGDHDRLQRQLGRRRLGHLHHEQGHQTHQPPRKQSLGGSCQRHGCRHPHTGRHQRKRHLH
ncbi:hypothetical protein ACHAWF_006240 [Thalassiosira exigua]